MTWQEWTSLVSNGLAGLGTAVGVGLAFYAGKQWWPDQRKLILEGRRVERREQVGEQLFVAAYRVIHAVGSQLQFMADYTDDDAVKVGKPGPPGYRLYQASKKHQEEVRAAWTEFMAAAALARLFRLTDTISAMETVFSAHEFVLKSEALMYQAESQDAYEALRMALSENRVGDELRKSEDIIVAAIQPVVTHEETNLAKK